MARRKSAAELNREIDEALAKPADVGIAGRRVNGDRVLADLTRWGIDPELISEVRDAFRRGDHHRAMALARDLGWNRAAKRGRSGGLDARHHVSNPKKTLSARDK